MLKNIIKLRLKNYLENNYLLSINQNGFRSGRSTEDALYEVTGFLSRALDKGEKVLSIVLDLAKAFDTVDHNLLSNTFNSFGITGIC